MNFFSILVTLVVFCLNTVQAFYDEGFIGKVQYTFTDSSIVLHAPQYPDDNVKKALLQHPYPEKVQSVYVGSPSIDTEVLVAIHERTWFPNQVLYSFESVVRFESSTYSEEQMLDLLRQLPRLSRVGCLSILAPHISVDAFEVLAQLCPNVYNLSVKGLSVDNHAWENADFYFPKLVVLEMGLSELGLEGTEALSYGMKNFVQRIPNLYSLSIRQGALVDEAVIHVLDSLPHLLNLGLGDCSLLSDCALNALLECKQDFNFLSLHACRFSWDKIRQLISNQSFGCFFSLSIHNSKIAYPYEEALDFMERRRGKAEFYWDYNNVHYTAPIYIPRSDD